MDTTIFLAQFWGWFLVILAFIFLFRRKATLDELLMVNADKNFIILSGWLALPLGVATVILHNVWVADWRVVITIIGWLSIFKGVMRIGFPEIVQKILTTTFRNKITLFRIIIVVAGLLGVWLIWMS